MQVISRVGIFRLCLVFAACAGFVQFVAPTELDLQEVSLANKTATTPAPKKRGMWSRLTGKGRKEKITLVKGNIEERKEPWIYQVVVEQAGQPKKESKPKTFYKDATISFDLADGEKQGIKVIGTGAFVVGEDHYLPVIENGSLLAKYEKRPIIIEIFGIKTTGNQGETFTRASYYDVTKSQINGDIQYQIDQVKGMKNSARAKVGRGLTTLKAGATQIGEAFSRKKLTPVEKPAQSEASREEY